MRLLLISTNTNTQPFPVYPLGMAIIGSALTRSGHEVEQFDFLAAGQDENLLRARMAEFAPECVCLSIRNLDNCDSFTATSYPVVAKRIVDLVRATCQVPVILGGPAFSILPRELLAYTGADHGVIGEGESLICSLVEDLAAGRTPGPLHRSSSLIAGEAIPGAMLTQELVNFYLAESGMVNIQSKRGCPHGCVYCSYPNLEGRNYRAREPREVVEEMARAVADHGVERFFFTDSVFNDLGGHYLELAEEMLRRDLRSRWCCYLRPQGLGRKEVALLKRAGLYAAEMGTDGASDTTLRALGKGFGFQEVLEVNRACVAERLPIAHFVMFGGPGETRATLEEGLANLQQLEQTVVFAYAGIRILPDTALYHRAIREGVLSPDCDLREPVFYQSPTLASQIQEDLLTRAFRGKRDRFFPPSQAEARRSVLHRFGYRGLLWDSLIQFPPDNELPC
jgi:lipid biosynthesis B12-binding/radical SAM protein